MRKFLTVVAVFFFCASLALTGCTAEQTPADKAGDAMDKAGDAMDKAGDAAKDATTSKPK